MNLIISKLTIKDVLIIPIFTVIGLGSVYSYYYLTYGQIVNDNNVLYVDPYYLISIFLGGGSFFVSMFTLIPLWFLYISVKNRRLSSIIGTLPNKLLYKILIISFIIGGSLAFVSNVILIYTIIPEHGYVLCPKKIGYKKNLLRDYVLDPNQCERF